MFLIQFIKKLQQNQFKRVMYIWILCLTLIVTTHNCFLTHFVYYGKLKQNDYYRISNYKGPYLLHLNQQISLPENKTVPKQLNPVEKSDIKKMQVIYKHGGLYLDNDQLIDVQCIKKYLCPLSAGFYLMDWTDRLGDTWQNSVPISFIYSNGTKNPTIFKILTTYDGSIKQSTHFSGPFHAQNFRKQINFIKVNRSCQNHYGMQSWSTGQSAQTLWFIQMSNQITQILKKNKRLTKLLSYEKQMFEKLWNGHSIIFPQNYKYSQQQRANKKLIEKFPSHNVIQIQNKQKCQFTVIQFSNDPKLKQYMQGVIKQYQEIWNRKKSKAQKRLQRLDVTYEIMKQMYTGSEFYQQDLTHYQRSTPLSIIFFIIGIICILSLPFVFKILKQKYQEQIAYSLSHIKPSSKYQVINEQVQGGDSPSEGSGDQNQIKQQSYRNGNNKRQKKVNEDLIIFDINRLKKKRQKQLKKKKRQQLISTLTNKRMMQGYIAIFILLLIGFFMFSLQNEQQTSIFSDQIKPQNYYMSGEYEIQLLKQRSLQLIENKTAQYEKFKDVNLSQFGMLQNVQVGSDYDYLKLNESKQYAKFVQLFKIENTSSVQNQNVEKSKNSGNTEDNNEKNTQQPDSNSKNDQSPLFDNQIYHIQSNLSSQDPPGTLSFVQLNSQQQYQKYKQQIVKSYSSEGNKLTIDADNPEEVYILKEIVEKEQRLEQYKHRKLKELEYYYYNREYSLDAKVDQQHLCVITTIDQYTPTYEKQLNKLLKSIQKQNYTNYLLVLIEDSFKSRQVHTDSKHKTWQLKKYKHHIILIHNNRIYGQLANSYYYQHRYCKKGSIIVNLSSRGYLIGWQVFNILNRIFANPQIWYAHLENSLVMRTSVNESGYGLEWPDESADVTVVGNRRNVLKEGVDYGQIREKYIYNSSGMEVFRKQLMDKIPVSQLIQYHSHLQKTQLQKTYNQALNPEFYRSSTRLLAYPLLQLAGNTKTVVIDSIFYVHKKAHIRRLCDLELENYNQVKIRMKNKLKRVGELQGGVGEGWGVQVGNGGGYGMFTVGNKVVYEKYLRCLTVIAPAKNLS